MVYFAAQINRYYDHCKRSVAKKQVRHFPKDRQAKFDGGEVLIKRN